MKKFIVKFTEEAMSERKSLAKFIKEEAKAPLTAERYMSGLKEEIKKLENSAEAIVIDENLSRQIGIEVRRTNYKKMAIIFSVEGENVYIHRIVPQKMVIYPIDDK